jgi:iron complex outermembrane recepter protein
MKAVTRGWAFILVAACSTPGLAQDDTAQDTRQLWETDAPAEVAQGDPAAAPAEETPPAEAPPPVATIPVETGEAAAPDATELEAITVTAQKRVQRLTDVPINVSAVTRDDVHNVRIEQVRDLASYITNVDIKEQVPGAIPVVTIRGVGLDDFSSTNSPAAGIYVDQVTLSSLALMSFDLYDVERIEVLKGPQGTLYGRNSTAGAVNVLTGTPGMNREGYVKAGYGTYQTADLEGMFNLPIGDTLAVRIAGKMIKQDEGYWESRRTEDEAYAGPGNYPTTDPVVRDIGLRDVLSGRVRAAWQPIDTVTVDLKVESLRQRSEMGQPEMFGTAPRPSGSGTCVPIDPANCADFLGYSDDDFDPYVGDYRGAFPYDIDQTAETLLVDWDLGFGTLSSVSGHVDFERFFHIDVDATPADQFDFLQGDTVQQVTQELRLAGTTGLGDWLGGVFYGDDTITVDTDGRHQDLIPGETSTIAADQDTTSWAAFANMDWKLGAFADALEKFTVTTGLRYTDETRDYVGGTTWTVVIPGTLDNTFEDSSIDDQNWSWKAGLNFKPASAQLVFLNVSKGVKSGGYFAGVTNAQNQLEPYLPEELTAYEVGYKLAGPLSINTSAFYYDYRDKQTFMRAGGAAAQYIGNVDKAETKGFDFEASWRALEGLTLAGGFGILDTWMGGFVGPTDADMDGNGDPVPAGNQLPNSPELTWLAKVRYELPIGSWLAAAQADAHYSDAAFKEATNDPLIKSGEYTVMNARLAFLPVARNWEFALWGRNITDEQYVVQGLDIATFALGNRNYNAPQTFGAELAWNF